MLPIRSVLVRCLPFVVLVGTAEQASAQVRVRSEVLSPGVRDAIRRGAVVKQTPTATTPDTVAAASQEVVLRRNEVLMARTHAPVFERAVPATDPEPTGTPTRGQDSVYSLGVEFVGVAAGSARPVNYKPVFIRHGAAYFQPDANSYQAHFSVAVIDASGASGYDLATPLTMTFGGDPESYDPPNVSVRRTGEAPARVKLSSRSARDSVSIRIFMGSDTEGIPFAIPVDQPKLQLAGPPKIQGYGVDFAKYQVRTSATSGSGNVILRSRDGLGIATVTASALNMSDGTIDVEFVPPYQFLLFMLAGGVIGALYAESQAKKRKGTHKGIRRFLGAVLGGVLATVAYVGLGINILSMAVSAPLASEIAVFAFAALGAAFGLKLAAGGEAVTA